MRSIYAAAVVAFLVPLAFLAGRLAAPGGADGTGDRRALYYVDPMNPAFRSPEPGTAPCGMPLEPVYAEGSAPGSASVPGAVPVRADRLQLIGVTREQVRSRTVRQSLRLLGTVAADETRLYSLSAATPGRALEMGAATTGSLVARGQILGAYYSQELIVPQQNFIRILKTYDGLRRTGINVHDNMQGGTQMAAYERNLLYARQTLLNLGMSPEQITEISATGEVSYMVQIRAPAAGIVLARRVTLGQSFDVGDELFRIADLESVWVLADALEGQERLFAPGMRATLTVPATGLTFPATVSRVPPQFEAATRTLKIRLEAHNPGLVLRPEMFVDVELPIEAGPAHFLPKEAVLDSGARQVVFVEQETGVFVPRRVRTGRRLGDQVEIVAGLMAGETVVTSGNFLLDSESRMRAAGATATAEAALDPICGMEVDADGARAQGLASEHAGRIWFFCSSGCKATFDRDPRLAAGRAEPATEHAVPAARHEAMAGREDGAMPPLPAAAAGALAGGTSGDHLSPPHIDHPAPLNTDLPGGTPGGFPGLERDEGPEDGAVGWQTTMPAPRDPVCGMMVDVARAVAEGLATRHGTETYYFCTPACKKEFDADPSVFVQSSR